MINCAADEKSIPGRNVAGLMGLWNPLAVLRAVNRDGIDDVTCEENDDQRKGRGGDYEILSRK